MSCLRMAQALFYAKITDLLHFSTRTSSLINSIQSLTFNGAIHTTTRVYRVVLACVGVWRCPYHLSNLPTQTWQRLIDRVRTRSHWFDCLKRSFCTSTQSLDFSAVLNVLGQVWNAVTVWATLCRILNVVRAVSNAFTVVLCSQRVRWRFVHFERSFEFFRQLYVILKVSERLWWNLEQFGQLVSEPITIFSNILNVLGSTTKILDKNNFLVV